MPYIVSTRRLPARLGDPKDAGELNYKLTMIVLDYIGKRGVSYAVLNEVVGVLECVKQELYRKKVSPYEEKKAAENGEIF